MLYFFFSTHRHVLITNVAKQSRDAIEREIEEKQLQEPLQQQQQGGGMGMGLGLDVEPSSRFTSREADHLGSLSYWRVDQEGGVEVAPGRNGGGGGGGTAGSRRVTGGGGGGTDGLFFLGEGEDGDHGGLAAALTEAMVEISCDNNAIAVAAAAVPSSSGMPPFRGEHVRPESPELGGRGSAPTSGEWSQPLHRLANSSRGALGIGVSGGSGGGSGTTAGSGSMIVATRSSATASFSRFQLSAAEGGGPSSRGGSASPTERSPRFPLPLDLNNAASSSSGGGQSSSPPVSPLLSPQLSPQPSPRGSPEVFPAAAGPPPHWATAHPFPSSWASPSSPPLPMPPRAPAAASFTSSMGKVIPLSVVTGLPPRGPPAHVKGGPIPAASAPLPRLQVGVFTGFSTV